MDDVHTMFAVLSTLLVWVTAVVTDAACKHVLQALST